MDDYILQLKGIGKTFPGVRALSNVTFGVKRGHVHALVGENGAGKSTMIKIICGLYGYGTYEGELYYNGELCKFKTISEVEKAGIACIHQELNLCRDLSVMENIFLSDKPTKGFGIIDYNKMNIDAYALLKRIGLADANVTTETIVKNLGIGQQQMVEIAKALAKHAKLLILDEPTAPLTEAEVDVLLEIVDKLRAEGVTCIYISHRLDEVMRIADDITVIRDGQHIETRPRSQMEKQDMINLMVGRELTQLFPREQHTRGEVGFEVNNYTVPNPDIEGRDLIKGVSFKAYKGEILGFSGLMGAGRTEMFTAMFGAYRAKGSGEIKINGKPVKINNPTEALKNGFFIISEDRKQFGLNLMMSIKENITIASLDKVSRMGILDNNKELLYSDQYIKSTRMRTPNAEVAVSTLSGGNQQKVVLAKAMMCEPQVIVFDEPTRGIDVGAKAEIYKLMNRMVEEGKIVIMISSEMEEILGMSDRIYTVAQGKITGEFDYKEATQEILMAASVAED
ncbi:MAG: ATP-binding cassette domain-containing protein [Lachnospiraceae bacterium]|nr:ATP-binding cassette domain-containing protein [Lachnospiraceae bacterium]